MRLQDVRMRFGRCMECARGNSGAKRNGAPLGAPLKGYFMRRDGTLSNLTPVAASAAAAAASCAPFEAEADQRQGARRA